MGVLEFVKGTTLVTIGTSDGPGVIRDARFRGLAATDPAEAIHGRPALRFHGAFDG